MKYILKIVLLLSSIAMLGCGVSFRFGEPPQVPSAEVGADPVKTCYERNRIQVRPATAIWVDRSGTGDVSTVHRYQGDGVAFYMDGSRKNADEILEMMADPRISDLYTETYERAEKRGFAHKLAGWILTGTAAAALSSGTGLLVAGVSQEPRHKSMTFGGAALIVTGLVAVIPGGHLLRSGYKHSHLAKAHRTIFISPDLKKNLSRSIDYYNEQVMTKCRAAHKSP